MHANFHAVEASRVDSPEKPRQHKPRDVTQGAFGGGGGVGTPERAASRLVGLGVRANGCVRLREACPAMRVRQCGYPRGDARMQHGYPS